MHGQRATSKIQRNNYRQGSCGPSITGKTSSVSLIFTHGAHRNVKNRQVKDSLNTGNAGPQNVVGIFDRIISRTKNRSAASIDFSSLKTTNNQTKKIMTQNSSVACFYTRRTKRRGTNQMLMLLVRPDG